MSPLVIAKPHFTLSPTSLPAVHFPEATCAMEGFSLVVSFEDGRDDEPLAFLPSNSDSLVDGWCLLLVPYHGFEATHRVSITALLRNALHRDCCTARKIKSWGPPSSIIVLLSSAGPRFSGIPRTSQVVFRASAELPGSLEVKSFQFLQCTARVVEVQCPVDIIVYTVADETEALVTWPSSSPRYDLATTPYCAGGTCPLGATSWQMSLEC